MLQQNELPAVDNLITVTPAAVKEAKRLMALELPLPAFERTPPRSGFSPWLPSLGLSSGFRFLYWQSRTPLSVSPAF